MPPHFASPLTYSCRGRTGKRGRLLLKWAKMFSLIFIAQQIPFKRVPKQPGGLRIYQPVHGLEVCLGLDWGRQCEKKVGDQPNYPERLVIKPVQRFQGSVSLEHHFLNAQSEDITWDCVVKKLVPVMLVRRRRSQAGAAGQVCSLSAAIKHTWLKKPIYNHVNEWTLMSWFRCLAEFSAICSASGSFLRRCCRADDDRWS